MAKTTRARKGATTQATRLGGDALTHALEYARTRGCTLRLAVEAILLRDHNVLGPMAPELLSKSGPARRMPAKRKTSPTTRARQGATP